MRKSLSDFASEREKDRQSNKQNDYKDYQEAKAFSQSSQTPEQTAEQILNKYSSYSKSELEGEIKDRVASLKQSGQFDKQKLLNSYSMIEGFLSPEQRSQMLSMIEGLDEKD